MKKPSGLYGICLMKAIGAMAPSTKNIKLRMYMNARKTFLSNIKTGENALAATSIALFDAAGWDIDKYILGMKAVSKCLKEHNCSAEDLV